MIQVRENQKIWPPPLQAHAAWAHELTYMQKPQQSHCTFFLSSRIKSGISSKKEVMDKFLFFFQFRVIFLPFSRSSRYGPRSKHFPIQINYQPGCQPRGNRPWSTLKLAWFEEGITKGHYQGGAVWGPPRGDNSRALFQPWGLKSWGNQNPDTERTV